jgi:MarR family transcriptional regulator, organic hydroperoxide resistance regulator
MEEEIGIPHPSSPGAHADLGELVTRAERLLARRFTPVLAAAGLSIDGWRVMCLLADHEGHPMTEVATRTFLPPASLTKLMDQLVDTNLVYRRVDDLDRRRIRAHLTPRGHRLHERLRAELAADLAGLSLPGAEQQLLAGLLGRLTDALTESVATAETVA